MAATGSRNWLDHHLSSLINTNGSLSLQLPFAAAAVRVDDLKPAPRDLFLTPAERPFFPQRAVPKRQEEWLAGRVAAKEALHRLCPDTVLAGVSSWQSWSITADGTGRPLACSAAGKSVPVSISHSAGLAVAMAAPVSCGIDLQAFSPAVEKIRDRFSTAGERDILTNLAVEERAGLTLLWATKEALRKALITRPFAGFLELRLCRLAPLASGAVRLEVRFGRSPAGPLPVTGFFHDHFACALTALSPG